MDEELAHELWEGFQVLFSNMTDDGLFVGRVDERHATALEACSGETTAIDAVGVGHDVVEGYQFWGTRFPVVD